MQVGRHGTDLKSECYIPLTIDQLIERGACIVEVLPTSSRWFGVTYREDKPGVTKAMADLAAGGAYPAPLVG
jgi:hypothetical protein